jgi:hypothetical protein
MLNEAVPNNNDSKHMEQNDRHLRKRRIQNDHQRLNIPFLIIHNISA